MFMALFNVLHDAGKVGITALGNRNYRNGLNLGKVWKDGFISYEKKWNGEEEIQMEYVPKRW